MSLPPDDEHPVAIRAAPEGDVADAGSRGDVDASG